MAIPNDWKEVNLEKISALRKTTKNFIVETDDIRHAIKRLKQVNYKLIYFYRSDSRKADGVDPYYIILATIK